MQDQYAAFIAAAYGMSVLALAGLGLWIFTDARRTRRELAALDAANSGRRTGTGPT